MGRLGDAAKKASPGSDMYIKFEDGTEITLRLLGDPWVRTKMFPSRTKTDESGNPIMEPKTTFLWPVWDYVAGKIRILEQGSGVASQIDAVDDKWKNNGNMPPNYDLTVTATGTGLQRRYTVVPTPQQGTMPTLAKDDLPDMARFGGEGAMPLDDFLSQPETAEDTPKSDDIVITDLDDDKTINLDDIPF